jgi:DNA-binding response OmpR family regulator
MVLLVEDEDLLREMLEETLSEAGFGVGPPHRARRRPSCSE